MRSLIEFLDVRCFSIFCFVYVIVFSMAPPARSKFRWTTVVATGCKRVGRMKRINRRILVPASMLPCAIEEKLTLENVDGKEIERYETKVADKEGFTTKYPRKCPQFLEDGGVV